MRKILSFALIAFAITLMSAMPATSSHDDGGKKMAPTDKMKTIDFKQVQIQNVEKNSVDNLKEEFSKLNLSKKKLNKLEKLAKKAQDGNKSWIAALLLCFFVGTLGIHRFYLGYTWQGIVQLLTLGGLGIWTLIDFIRIIIKDLKPKDGDYNE